MGAELRTHGTDAAIADLAERQYGVVGRGQLEALGVTRREIGRRLEAKRLHSLHRGVFAVGHRVLSRHAHWLAAVLACGDRAVLSHRSAAALWGIRSYSGARVHVTSPSKTRSRGTIRRHCARLPADEVTSHEGIPVTSVPRTLFDLASSSSPQALEGALRQCEYLRLYDSLSLWDLLEKHPGHRGNRAVRAALANLGQTSGETRSPREDRFLAFLDANHLPRPQLNAWITVQGHRHQADCLWPRVRLIAELDSWQAHGTRSAFQADKARDRRLLLAGYVTTRITWHHLDHEAVALAADLKRLLAADKRT